MGRPLHADGRRTRQSILDAALELFADKGYFGTRLRDIAAAVGVRESALYNYFSSKEQLFEALIVADQEYRVERLDALMKEAPTDVRECLERLATLAIENFCAPRQEKLFRILLSDGMRLAKEGRINLFERMSSGQARLHEFMRRLVRSGSLRGGDPELLAIEFIGPLLLWRHLHTIQPSVPVIRNRKVFARDHVQQFLRGAAARPLDRSAERPRGGRVPISTKSRRPIDPPRTSL